MGLLFAISTFLAFFAFILYVLTCSPDDTDVKKEPTLLTFSDIYEQFLRLYPCFIEKISDWRPAAEPYFDCFVKNGIVIWLNTGETILYIYNESED